MGLEYSIVERNRLANDLFGGADFTIKAYSNTISATGTGGTEITSAGYSPIAVANNTTNLPAATTGTRTNAVEFFKSLTADASIKSIGIFKTSDGTFLARKVYDSPLAVLAGQDWRFPVGSMNFSFNNPS
jgi:hypothetical protein